MHTHTHAHTLDANRAKTVTLIITLSQPKRGCKTQLISTWTVNEKDRKNPSLNHFSFLIVTLLSLLVITDCKAVICCQHLPPDCIIHYLSKKLTATIAKASALFTKKTIKTLEELYLLQYRHTHCHCKVIFDCEKDYLLMHCISNLSFTTKERLQRGAQMICHVP